MTTRREQIEEAASLYGDIDEIQGREGDPRRIAECAFESGAEWADANPPMPDTATAIMVQEAMREETERYKRMIEEYPKLKQQLSIALSALNKIAIAQMGSMDYTEDFFEFTKMTVREALEQVKITK